MLWFRKAAILSPWSSIDQLYDQGWQTWCGVGKRKNKSTWAHTCMPYWKYPPLYVSYPKYLTWNGKPVPHQCHSDNSNEMVLKVLLKVSLINHRNTFLNKHEIKWRTQQNNLVAILLFVKKLHSCYRNEHKEKLTNNSVQALLHWKVAAHTYTCRHCMSYGCTLQPNTSLLFCWLWFICHAITLKS